MRRMPSARARSIGYRTSRDPLTSRTDLRQSAAVARHDHFFRDALTHRNLAAPAIRRIWRVFRTRRARAAQTDIVDHERLGRTGCDHALQSEWPDDAGCARRPRRPHEALAHVEGL